MMTGWLGIGLGALAYDVYAVRSKRCETLSCVAGRHPFVAGAGLVALALHFNSHRIWRNRV